jgi:hypothetical protein
MKKESRRTIAPAVLLVLLALLALLVVKRKDLTVEEAEVGAVREVVKRQHTILRDEYAVVAFLGLMALLAFVTWIVLRANEGEDEAMPRPPGPRGGA